MRRGLKLQEEWSLLIIKLNKYEQKPHRGGKAGCTGSLPAVQALCLQYRLSACSTGRHNTHTRPKTTDQHRTADKRIINRETNEAEGDTGGAT